MEELDNGCKLGIDSWADTACAGKHAFVEEFVAGKSVTVTGFTSALGTLNNLPIANVLYACDLENGTTVILESNNSIYMGSEMDNSLLNPIQMEENDVKVDIRPSTYYPNVVDAQTVIFEDGTRIPILYDGVLPYIAARRPTPEEIDSCPRLALTSRDDWNPFLLGGSFSRLSSVKKDGSSFESFVSIMNADPIGTYLTSEAMVSAIESKIVTNPIMVILLSICG